ncbi:MAG: type III-B CRISPR module RAMP protein Cmr6 [Myxococcales bacterium]|nr:type III-B CRISPR module RAMP protein Cmr6 [Myxococcales bacterium]
MVQKNNPSYGKPPGGGGGGGSKKKGPPSWDEVTYPLPAALRALVEETRKGTDPLKNLGLWIDKYLPREKGTWKLTAELRTMVLGTLCRDYQNPAAAEAAKRLKEGGYGDEVAETTFEARTDGRLLVDYGRKNATETALSFHPVLGVPQIPGSALKGMTRAYLTAIGEPKGKIERLCGSEPEKTPLKRGQVIFFDALPKDGKFTLSLDVLTPHMGDYYQGKSPPGDFLSPIPHTFLAVTQTTFIIRLSLSPPPGKPADETEAKETLMTLQSQVKEALNFFGVGAKKAAGYGRLGS